MSDQIPAADYTGGGLVEFLDAAIAKGWLNISTAKALKSTATKVLEIEPGWETIDLRSVETDALFQRFQNLRRNDYGDASLRVYRTRFAQAVKMYVARLDGDANWQAYGPSPKGGGSIKSTGAGPAKRNKPAGKPGSAPATNPLPEAVHRVESPALIRYPFPLRDDVDAVLSLPRDLTKAEAIRLGAFLQSLAREDGT